MLEDIAEKIGDTPSPVTIDFEILRNRNHTTTTTAAADDADASLHLPVGTVVTILKALQNGKPDFSNANAKVGDILRTKKVNMSNCTWG